ncbi:MAG TPA: TonB-dependent receptor, partial [Nevskiaceae bacterium]|nr:TonB-dependent receptor [Nevskiaceae bacterium]
PGGAAIPNGCNQDGNDPLFRVLANGRCGYDFSQIAANEAEVSNKGLFVKGRYEINDNWEFNTTGTITRAESFGRYAPALNDFLIFVDETNPFNDVGEDFYLYHRFVGLGPRDTTTDANIYDLHGAVSGKIGPVDVEAGARYSEYKYNEVGRNYLSIPVAAQAIAAGLYDFRNPYDADPDVVNSFRANTGREALYASEEAFASGRMDLFQMAGGTSQIVVGFEYRTEDYADLYDAQQEAGQIGGTAGNSAGGDRNARAYYAELGLPLLSNLEATLSARYDDYSDYGNDTSPAISLRYQPIDQVTLRAAFGQGFRAPILSVLTQKPAFSAEPINNDGPTCTFAGGDFRNGTCFTAPGSNQILESQVQTVIVSNSELASEQSDQYSFGVVVQPYSFLDFSIDYYSIEIDNLISFIDPGEIIARLGAGDPIPAGLGVTRDPNNGRILNVIAGFANEGTLETSGFDINVNTRFNLGAYGKIDSRLQGTMITDYSFDGGRNLAGDPGEPEMRWGLQNQYSISDFRVGYNVNYIDSQAQTVVAGVRRGKIASYTTHDLQLNYDAKWNGTLTVGANNIFGREPPLSPDAGRPYNFSLYDQYGTMPYVRYTQRF